MSTQTLRRLKPRSHVVTDGPDRAGARAMLRATGLTDDDFNKPFVGVANLASDITPCNVHLSRLAQQTKDGIRAAGSVPFLFGTITVSDAISMGTEGMKGSLVSREVIADSIETVCFAESMDSLVIVGGCDKNMPGAVMAIARLDLPSIFFYGGTIMPGRHHGQDVTIQDVYEVYGEFSAGTTSLEDLIALERVACPGPGSCAALYTANTMASAIEALGLSLPGASSIPAVDPRIDEAAFRVGPRAPASPGGGHHGPADPHAQGARKRHHCRPGHGRVDQRRPAPARHRPRGRGPAGDRRLRPAEPQHPLHRRPASRRPFRHVGPRRGGWRPRGDEGVAGRRPPPRRHADGDGTHAGGEPGERGRGARRPGGPHRPQLPQPHGRAGHPCEATWPRRALC